MAASKKIQALFAVLMVVAGSYLEITYYQQRFTNDGISPGLALVIGGSLTLLLALAFMNRRNWSAWLIIIPVLLYSIMATSAGQAFSLAEELTVTQAADVQQRYTAESIEEAQERIAELDSEIQRQRSLLPDDLEQRATWRTNVNEVEQRITELNQHREQERQLLAELRGRSTVHEEVRQRTTNIYEFYGGLFGWDEDWLQFILQTLLSAFIAAMVPIGMASWPKIEPKPAAEPEHNPTQVVDRSLVEKWVKVSYAGYRMKKLGTVVREDTFYKILENQGDRFPDGMYSEIRARAVDAGVIQGNGAITITDEKKAANMVLGVD